MYTLKELEAMPTLHSGHFANLKIDESERRVWLSRCKVADGEPYDNKVTVERMRDGSWAVSQEYKAR